MANIDGQPGPDNLLGTEFDDAINGKAGDDTLSGLSGNDELNGDVGYDTLKGGPGNDSYLLLSTSNAPFSSASLFFYDNVVELQDEGDNDAIIIVPSVQSVNRINFQETFYTNYVMPEFIERLSISDVGRRQFDIIGNGADNFISGSRGNNNISGGSGNDNIRGAEGDDFIDGGLGFDTASFLRSSQSYLITANSDGSFTVKSTFDQNNTALYDGIDIVRNVETLSFPDRSLSVILNPSFIDLVEVNGAQTKAISSVYQILNGGVPSMEGFDFLIKGNLATNFGAGRGPIFNDENIFINVANSLVQGNATAAAKFNALATGATLEAKVAALYAKIIPAGKQTAEGVAFITRADGIKFYKDLALERSITAENGPAVVALASLLKIAVDGKIGVGNAVSDLVLSIADGSSELPATSKVVVAIETVDGTIYDADDAPNVAATSPPPLPLIGLAADEALI